MTQEQAQMLIERDQAESTEPHGQRVNDTFHLADFFVRISDSHDRLRCDIQRLVELWFGNPFLTPSFDEYAMFMAFASALRSADLSRQVGAVITRDNDILSTVQTNVRKQAVGFTGPSEIQSAAAWRMHRMAEILSVVTIRIVRNNLLSSNGSSRSRRRVS